jgi:hypothetical protein
MSSKSSSQNSIPSATIDDIGFSSFSRERSVSFTFFFIRVVIAGLGRNIYQS